MMPGVSDDAEIDALYRLPLDGFVEARNALAARLRAGGDKDGASAVKALARPSVAAWALNQIYWTERPAFDALLEASARLHAAQAAGDAGAELREATKARREATGALLKKAESILAAAGHGNTAAVQQRVSNTLLALAGPGGGGPEARPGRLTRDLDPPGFEALSGVAAFPVRPKETKPQGLALVPPPADAAKPGVASKDPDETDDARAQAEAALALAERALDRARSEVRVAEGELTIAKNRAAGARSELEEATRRLDRARERASVTENDETAAGDKVTRAAEARERAEAERDAALRALRSLE